MVDYTPDFIGLAALLVAGAAGWFNWRQTRAQEGQLRAQREQLDATITQLRTEEQKVEQLTGLVGSLADMVETQKLELAVVQKQLEIATKAFELQKATLDFQKQASERDALLKQAEIQTAQAQLSWDQTGPLAKAKMWADQGIQNVADKLRRIFSRKSS